MMLSSGYIHYYPMNIPIYRCYVHHSQSWVFHGIVLPNNVLLVKIEGPVWYTIYHQLPIVKGVCYTPLY